MNFKRAGGLLAESAVQWQRHNASHMAAALAFYAVFSLVPMLIVLLAVGGLVFGEAAAKGEIVHRVRLYVGHNGAEAIQQVLMSVRESQSGALAVVMGAIMGVLGASGVFLELHNAMNAIWGPGPTKRKAIWAFLWKRLVSLLMVMGVGLMLLISLVISTVLSWVRHQVATTGLAPPHFVWRAVYIGVSLVLMCMLLAMIYKVLPEVKVRWSDVLPGALLAAVLLAVGRVPIDLYLERASVASAFGAAGSLALLLLAIYYSAMIVIFGAEVAEVYARRFGSRREDGQPGPA